MSAQLTKFQNTLRIGEYIDNNLEGLARYLKGNNDGSPTYTYDSLCDFLRELYPEMGSAVTELADDLIREHCLVQYLKLLESKRTSDYMQGP